VWCARPLGFFHSKIECQRLTFGTAAFVYLRLADRQGQQRECD